MRVNWGALGITYWPYSGSSFNPSYGIDGSEKDIEIRAGDTHYEDEYSTKYHCSGIRL